MIKIPEEAARKAIEAWKEWFTLGHTDNAIKLGREALRLAEPVPACCADCAKPYSDFPLDATLPHDQWERIMGSPNGLLCANCMVARASKLPGAVAVRMTIDCDAAEPEPDLAERAVQDLVNIAAYWPGGRVPREHRARMAYIIRTAISKAVERERAAVAERDRERVEAVRMEVEHSERHHYVNVSDRSDACLRCFETTSALRRVFALEDK